MHASAALDATRTAVSRRTQPGGLVHYSGRGGQYACRECRDLPEDHGMAKSMSRSGNCSDNATMGSPGETPKKKLVRGRLVCTHEDPRLTRLRQPRGIRGGRKGEMGPRWVSAGLVGVHGKANAPQQPNRITVRETCVDQIKSPVQNITEIAAVVPHHQSPKAPPRTYGLITKTKEASTAAAPNAPTAHRTLSRALCGS